MEERQPTRNDRRDTTLAWFAVGLSCVYFIWSYVSLETYTKVFLTLFTGLGVELPPPTRFVIASHFWVYPLLFCGAGALAIAKEFVIRDKRMSLLQTLVISLVVLFAVDWIKQVFTLPLLDLVQKLK